MLSITISVPLIFCGEVINIAHQAPSKQTLVCNNVLIVCKPTWYQYFFITRFTEVIKMIIITKTKWVLATSRDFAKYLCTAHLINTTGLWGETAFVILFIDEHRQRAWAISSRLYIWLTEELRLKFKQSVSSESFLHTIMLCCPCAWRK